MNRKWKFEVEITDEPGVHIINNDEYNLPTDPEKNAKWRGYACIDG